MFFRKLYLRIWLAVVLAVVLLTTLVGWAWRMTAEVPLREVVVRNDAGEVVGHGEVRMTRREAARPRATASASAADGTGANAGVDDTLQEDAREIMQHGRNGTGPEFTVQMNDGQTLHLHMPRPAANWHAPFGFFWTLGLVAVAVAVAVFPIVRRITHRLESLLHSVEMWGNGDLAVRMPRGGNDEIASLAAGFNRAADQIEGLIRTRDALLASQRSLLANASHELRSPLTRIRMGLEFMGVDASSAAHTEISRNIVELDQLIDEILLSSRLDAREADLGTIEHVDLVVLAAEECAHCGAILDAGGAQSLVVPGVAKLLRRTVRNLLENARRYGAGEVSLCLSTRERFAVIEVSDCGPGVPPALQERIFEPFYRLPGASEREGGVGLGLALVKSIVLRHGGTVVCRNRSEGGATFEVCLPLAS